MPPLPAQHDEESDSDSNEPLIKKTRRVVEEQVVVVREDASTTEQLVVLSTEILVDPTQSILQFAREAVKETGDNVNVPSRDTDKGEQSLAAQYEDFDAPKLNEEDFIEFDKRRVLQWIN